MIILDSNVLSELTRPAPTEAVIRWMARQPALSLFTTSITQAEMLLGVRLLPSGRKRTAIEQAVMEMFGEDFAGRILPFDREAVPAYVDIVATRRKLGRPISQFDAQIAAIARTAGAHLATRNTVDFESCDVGLINPWKLA